MAKFVNINQLRKASKTVTLNREGENYDVTVWPLTAREMESIRKVFPPPPTPLIERGGEMVPNFNDEEHRRAVSALDLRRTYAMAATMIGLESLGVETIEDGAEAMAANFYESEIGIILEAGLNQRSLTESDIKGAAHNAAPFGS